MLTGSSRSYRATLAFTLAACCCALRPAGAQRVEPVSVQANVLPPYAIRIAHRPTADLLRLVLDGARRRLAKPRCEAVLDAFAAESGGVLRDRLGESSQSAAGYLGLIIFYDGSKLPPCGKLEVLAVTAPGSRVVYVCSEQFRDAARANPLWVEATLIHEALHTLGLGENPPSSQEITSRVIRLCRR
jgi:hypothetical protein